MYKIIVITSLSIFIASCDNSDNSLLKEISKNINENCPMKIDSYTTLYTTSVMKNTLTYYYSIDEKVLSDNNINKSYWSTEQQLHLNKNYCTNPDLSVFREHNISVRWKYNNLEGFPFGLFEFNNDDCNN
tara:strand:+ start:137 stop:526 length:390 start_codon:yes stop_codon:yes gene_type:complete